MNVSAPPAPKQAGRSQKHRGFWLKTMIQWHWVSSALCLVGMVMFSITGITLNHAGRIESKPVVVAKTAELPPELLKSLNAPRDDEAAMLPADVAGWLGDRLSMNVGSDPAEWSEAEVYVSMPGPGTDAWLTIDRETGDVEFESTDRGWIAYFNDLHKGRHAGAAWSWFLDLFAAACLVFCLTGLYLLYFHARHRRMTWSVVAMGLIVPLILAVLMSRHAQPSGVNETTHDGKTIEAGPAAGGGLDVRLDHGPRGR